MYDKLIRRLLVFFWVGFSLVVVRLVIGKKLVPFAELERKSIVQLSKNEHKRIKCKIKKSDWIDIQNNPIDEPLDMKLKFENGKTICNVSKVVIQVKLVSQHLIKSKKHGVYLRVRFISRGSKFAKYFGPYPLIQSYRYNIESTKLRTLPSNFEGYLTCLKEGEEVILTPKYMEKETFIKGLWTVRVHVKNMTNPLMPYGIQSLITVLDNVQITESGKRSFFLPFGYNSEANACFMLLAEKETLAGRTCTLSREENDSKMRVHCDSWNWKTKLNSFFKNMFSMWLGMNSMHCTMYYLLKYHPIRYDFEPFTGVKQNIRFHPSKKKNIPFTLSGPPITWRKRLLSNDEHVEPEDPVQYHDSYKQAQHRGYWIVGTTNLLFVLVTLFMLVHRNYGKPLWITRKLSKIKWAYYDFPKAYPWKLAKPEVLIT